MTNDEIEAELMALVDTGDLAFGVDENGEVCWWSVDEIDNDEEGTDDDQS